MPFQIVPGTAADLPEMAIIFAKAMEADPFWRAMNGPDCTFEEECALNEQSLRPRVGPGAEFGACQTWKIVDGEGYGTFSLAVVGGGEIGDYELTLLWCIGR
jgi:hypothetical protein